MNAMLTIQPYFDGVWRFDDERVGLLGEPFVGDINTMIDQMVDEAGVRGACAGFLATFSAVPFPGYHMKLDYLRGAAKSGTDYRCNKYRLVGWLCPALSRYFPVAPPHIYVKAEPLRRRSGRCEWLRRMLWKS